MLVGALVRECPTRETSVVERAKFGSVTTYVNNKQSALDMIGQLSGWNETSFVYGRFAHIAEGHRLTGWVAGR